ncbi:hypothetical protein NE235_09225 [Actinoallomurus spadix]|uniref:Uncharacterized protein n=1 Tax=Actinoallomurus spadix TaxID=79912 RepID=A0ABN0W6Q9_9ACTN|nr:hypothetical protein [Actinoallomurus spadix]MCO5986288.1 hypothetical protein [Actinoallomurus spadix]
MRYTRIVRTEDGGSAFEEKEIALAEQHVADGVPHMAVGAPPFEALFLPV